MDFMRTSWTLWGAYDCISYSLHRVHVDFSWTPHGVQRDFQSPQTVFHRFREDSARSLWNTVHGVTVDSMRTPCLTYLIKSNFNHTLKQVFTAGVKLRTFQLLYNNAPTS